MMASYSDPAIIAAVASALTGILTALIAGRVQKALKRDDAASLGLKAQLDGWSSLAGAGQKMVDDLWKALQQSEKDCEERIAAVESEMRHRDDICRQRLAEMETKVRYLQGRR